jgi:hypothetical protein
MYSSPLHAVDKPRTTTLTTTFWLINNQSAGEFSPNSMIGHEDFAGTCMDIIKSLGASLQTFCKANGDSTKLIMWKFNIEAAYCNLWLAKEWQVKQIVTVGNKHYVNHCNCFGNCSLYKVFLSLSSIIVWIAENIKNIPHLKAYVDDNASFNLAGNVLYYEPYHCYFPSKQTKPLLLWDELNIPHVEKKQIYSPIIPCVGFDVDPNKMMVSISNNCCADFTHLCKTQQAASPSRV